MSCYTDTIVKVKLVCRTEKQDGNVDVYSVKHKDNEIEMILSVLIEFHERDFEILRKMVTILSQIK